MIASDPHARPSSAPVAGPGTVPSTGPGETSERLADYLYELPPELIAQAPAPERTGARLLVAERGGPGLVHTRIAELPGLLTGDELLVFNDTRVVAARLHGRKESGGRIELLALRPVDDPAARAFVALGRASKGFKPGALLHLDRGGGQAGAVRVLAVHGDGSLTLALPDDCADLWELLARAGEIPLPPYVARPDGPGADDAARYQTVFARHPGAVAAPTAGLHFTDELLAAVRARGCEVAFVTLHVGPGTFAPVKVERLDEHKMHCERWHVAPAEAARIEAARAAGRPVLAVGTTVVRTLEAVAAAHDGRVVSGSGETDIFIRPGFGFRVVDQLLTNFHLPGSTLLMLVAAFAAGRPGAGAAPPGAAERGRERVLAAYRAAIAAGYRFYSYGDGMLLR